MNYREYTHLCAVLVVGLLTHTVHAELENTGTFPGLRADAFNESPGREYHDHRVIWRNYFYDTHTRAHSVRLVKLLSHTAGAPI
jgi:hypothetical protein